MSMEEDLGKYICVENPYTELPFAEGPPQQPKTGTMAFKNNWQNAVEVDIAQGYGYQWSFDGKPRNVNKALRITYTYEAEYTLSTGQKQKKTITEHLLVGYEGGPGI